MKYKDLFENWGLTRINLNLKFANIEFSPKPDDEIAAWEMYVELVTRITTQDLCDEVGDEISALDSIHQLFPITRSILKEHGRKCDAFSKLAIIILNQIVRPFTAKWHKAKINGILETPEGKQNFREELKTLQKDLRIYCAILADIAKVEDLTTLVIE